MEFENNKGCVSCFLCRGVNRTEILNGAKMFMVVIHLKDGKEG